MRRIPAKKLTRTFVLTLMTSIRGKPTGFILIKNWFVDVVDQLCEGMEDDENEGFFQCSLMKIDLITCLRPH